MILDSHERSLLRELVGRDGLAQAVRRALHPKQRCFARDRSRRVAAHCGRRSGKSTGIAGKFFLAALEHPGETSVFIAISAARANDIIGRALRILGRAIGWEARQTSRAGQLYWVFPNGHKLWVAGCKNKSEAEKFRGDPYCGSAVDEADSLRGHLQYLVEDVLEPALLDYDGWLTLTGTPGVTPAGYFHDVTTGSNGQRRWATYHWTCLDNPFLRDPAGWLRRRREELGLDETSPTYRREWLGEWIADLDSLVYSYDYSRNATADRLDLSSPDWRFVIGVDLGVIDATALVAGAYQLGVPDLHLLESQSWPGLSPSGAYARVMEWRQRYPNARIVADTGGLGKAFVTEWSERFGLWVEPARKIDLLGQVAFVNGLLRSGVVRLHLPGCRSLAHEWSQLPWDETRKGHDESYPDHESDAARYCLLAMRPNYRAEPEPPVVGSREWQEQESARLKAEVLRRHMRRPR